MRLLLLEPGSTSLIQLLANGGPTALLAAGLVAFMKGWIVSKREADQLREERDQLRELVYHQAGLASRAIDTSMERLEVERRFLDMLRKERDDSDRGTGDVAR